MTGEAEDEPMTSSRSIGWRCIWWVGVALLLYVLSSGPVLMMINKHVFRPGSAGDQLINAVYSRPAGWAYDRTLLHKPLGIYWHFWAPKVFDNKGDLTVIHK